MTFRRRRKRRVSWLPTQWQAGTSTADGFNLGFGALTATPLLGFSDQATVSADNAQLYNSPFRMALELRLERLIGDISFDALPGSAAGEPVGYDFRVHYGFAIVRTQPESGTPSDLADWDPSVFDNQKRWLWRRSMAFNVFGGATLLWQRSLNQFFLPWGTWHDIKPRARIKFGEEDLFLITVCNVIGGTPPAGTPEVSCAINMRALVSRA